MKPLESKSNITAIIAGIVNLFYQLNQSQQWFDLPDNFIETANTVLFMLWGIFMRQGVAKSGPQEQTNIAQTGP